MVPYILVIEVILKFQLDVFYLFICRLYMFRATPIYAANTSDTYKQTTIRICTTHPKQHT